MIFVPCLYLMLMIPSLLVACSTQFLCANILVISEFSFGPNGCVLYIFCRFTDAGTANLADSRYTLRLHTIVSCATVVPP